MHIARARLGDVCASPITPSDRGASAYVYMLVLPASVWMHFCSQQQILTYFLGGHHNDPGQPRPCHDCPVDVAIGYRMALRKTCFAVCDRLRQHTYVICCGLPEYGASAYQAAGGTGCKPDRSRRGGSTPCLSFEGNAGEQPGCRYRTSQITSAREDPYAHQSC